MVWPWRASPPVGLVTLTLTASVLVALVPSLADADGVGEPAATVAAAAINPRPATANPRNRITEVRVDAAVVRSSFAIGSITAQRRPSCPGGVPGVTPFSGTDQRPPACRVM